MCIRDRRAHARTTTPHPSAAYRDVPGTAWAADPVSGTALGAARNRCKTAYSTTLASALPSLH
eukprot:7779642-Alexandrium_andersonii.AAC.1